MAQTPVHINLDPASVLYLRKLSLRKRDGITSHAVALPRFSWGIDKARLPAKTDKEMIKEFMHAFAHTWRDMQAGGGDKGVVTLIKVNATDTRFEFEAQCPYPQLVAPIVHGPAEHQVPRSAAPLDIRHKYGLLEGRCPVVFVWRQATSDVLITNECHLANPEQFLAIDRVATTSGFLNFVGAINVIRARDQNDAAVMARLPGMMKDAMVARADEWLRWFHHCVDEGVIFDPKRVLVDDRDYETYYYDYSGKPV